MLESIIKAKFIATFNAPPALMVRSSGRINLIGEHTDYNDGYVLPAAIDKSVYLAIGARTDQACHLVAHDLDAFFQTDLRHLTPTREQSWANYLMGVLSVFQQDARTAAQLRGINVVFGADLPSGAGMSSSAAIENGLGVALNTLFGLGYSQRELIMLSQKAENQFVGMNCGVMDMFASMMGRKNHFIRIDCRDLSYAYFPFDTADVSIVLCNTTVQHQLVDSEYNVRRAECEEGVRFLQGLDPEIQSLRDVTPDHLQQHGASMRPVVLRRCQYVVEEQSRVLQACSALEQHDFERLGQLLLESHAGLSRQYEVSCPELDFLVETAKGRQGFLGARMMGGGFGGCTINLVRTEFLSAFVEQTGQAFAQQYGRVMPWYVVRPGDGVSVIDTL